MITLPLRDAGRHGQRVIVLRERDARFPDDLAGLGVKRVEPSIERGRDDFPLIERNAAVHNAAADLRPHGGLVDFRIPAPFLFAGAGVDRVHDAPVRDAVERAIRVERCTFLITAATGDVIGPREAEAADVRGVDLFERTVAGFTGSEPVGEPFSAGLARGLQRGIVDSLRLLGVQCHSGAGRKSKTNV